MAVVRKPGTTVDVPLNCDRNLEPEVRAAWVVKVLNWEEWKQFSRRLQNVQSAVSTEDTLDRIRKLLGVGLVGVKGLKVLSAEGEEPEEFILKKEGNDITMESMAYLMPFKEEILDAVQGAHQFGLTDAKNLR